MNCTDDISRKGVFSGVLTTTSVFPNSSAKRPFAMAFSDSITTPTTSSNPATFTFSNLTTCTSALSNFTTALAFSNSITTTLVSSVPATFTFSNPTYSPSALVFSNSTTSTSAISTPTTSAHPSLSTTTTTSFSFFNATTTTCPIPCVPPNPCISSSTGLKTATGFTFGCSSTPKSSSISAQRKPKPSIRLQPENSLFCFASPFLVKKPPVDASTQTETELPGVNKLLQGLKETLHSSKHSDFVLNVQGKEFRVHKIILEIHSPVFAAMMEHDTKEKATGIANIDDFKPITISNFLEFLYTAKVENLNSDNVIDLYKVADKYQVKELCDLCIEYMTNNISMENFCDILNLSLCHHVWQLTEVATQFFLKNTKEIAKTAKWGVFLSQNPVAGNELFLKALEKK